MKLLLTVCLCLATAVALPKRSSSDAGMPVANMEKRTASRIHSRSAAGSHRVDKKMVEALMDMLHSNGRQKRGKVGVTEADKAEILEAHNSRRAGVQPTSDNMVKMYWDDQIAVIAQGWTDGCPNGHDTAEDRAIQGWGINIGQNWAYGQKDWTAAVEAWYSEVEFFTYGVDPGSEWWKIGHFTQVVRDVAGLVGCGFKDCPQGPMYICNYAFGNPFFGEFGTPYNSGPSCGQCPNNCNDNLCDCQGKICLNGGTMDLGSCSCSCAYPFSGDNCGQAECTDEDPDYCGMGQPYGYDRNDCDEFMNVPEECPKLCGVC